MKNTKITFKIDIMLFIIFLILKLDGIIQWKWIWVFAPLWVVWLIQGFVTIVAMIINGIAKWNIGCSVSSSRMSGPRLVWDATTNTLHGPWDAENNETE